MSASEFAMRPRGVIAPRAVAEQYKRERGRLQTQPTEAQRASEVDDFIDESEALRQVSKYLAFKDNGGVVFSPVGHRIAILLFGLPETVSGIELPRESQEAQAVASPQGVVVELGPTAYQDPVRFPGGPWCKVGERICFYRYSGRVFTLYNRQKITFLNDDEVAGCLPGDLFALARSALEEGTDD